jgi:hypothetical protein
MPLSIKDPNADRLAQALAQRAGETLTESLINAPHVAACLVFAK